VWISSATERIEFVSRWMLVLSVVLWCGTAGADEDAFKAGPELRLSGTIGILTTLAESVEETSGYRASVIADSDLTAEPAVGFNLGLGWRFQQRLSASLRAEHLADFSVDLENGRRGAAEAGNSVLTGESWALTADARVYLLTGAIQPFLTAGAGWMWVETDDENSIRAGVSDGMVVLGTVDTGIGARNGFVSRVGGGVDFYLSDAFFLSAEATVVVPVGRVRDFDYVSVAWGFGYRF
jgi:opacity protein-like surface antigen